MAMSASPWFLSPQSSQKLSQGHSGDYMQIESLQDWQMAFL